ncbi:BLUF domain-containing protein [Aquimarina longa]|uniref:BLUF domain-containing protein n=1 Tax=Aquimarina longa TaxID=1080221 RepID=UPI0007828131|nr:BLUF domain-containing protein [Aquimarina longa]
MKYIISYVSTANPNTSRSDMIKLIDFIKYNNKEIGIAGILIYSDGNFFQILEGEKEIVKMMFERIKRDPRHYDIIKMLDKEIIEFNFLDYDSSFTIISDHYSQNKLQQFLKKEKTYNPEHYKSISYLTQKFMKLS